MPRRRHSRPIKTPVFLAGEGKSELGYGRWLHRLAANHSVPIAFRVEGLRGSDPLDLVIQAIDKLAHAERHRGSYHHRGLLLDSDLLGNNIRDRQAYMLADQKRLKLIWQRPTHEGFLLRHFLQYQNHNPPDSNKAHEYLLQAWPEYRKGQDALSYENEFSMDNLIIARGNVIELNEFLDSIGWQ